MSKQSEKKISFEEALHELEKIASSLEAGNLSLEDSIAAYEKGMELKKICQERLKEAEGKIEYLSRSEDGKTQKETVQKSKKTESSNPSELF